MSSRAARRDLVSQYLSQVLVNTNVLNQGVTVPTQRLISTFMYNFGVVSPFRKNSSSRPAPCFLPFEQTKRYAIPIVPEAKSDADFVHQLSTEELSLKVWTYVIMRSENIARLVLYGSLACAKALQWFDHKREESGVWSYANLCFTLALFDVNCWWAATIKVVQALVFELECLYVIGLMALLYIYTCIYMKLTKWTDNWKLKVTKWTDNWILKGSKWTDN